MKANIRKNQIMQTAKAVFARHGYHQTNIAMICSQAGIGRGTLYQYFKNKKAVFQSIIENIIGQAIQLVEYTPKPIESVDQLFELQAERLEKIFRLFLLDRSFTRVAFGVSSEFPKMRQMVDQHFTAIIQRELEHMQRFGLLKDGIDPEPAAIYLCGGLQKIVMNYLLDRKKFSKQGEIKDLVRQILRMDFYGLLAPHSSETARSHE